MLQKAKFLAQLQLPPSHESFPVSINTQPLNYLTQQPAPLLHAILAVTTTFLPETLLASREYWPTGTPMSAPMHPVTDNDMLPHLNLPSGKQPPGEYGANWQLPVLGEGAARSPVVRFQLWHRRLALEGVNTRIRQARNPLQMCQAHVIAQGCDEYNGWYVDRFMNPSFSDDATGG
jgi:hypothetical protein